VATPPLRTIGQSRVHQGGLVSIHCWLVGVREISTVVFQIRWVNEWLTAVPRLYTPPDHLSWSSNCSCHPPAWLHHERFSKGGDIARTTSVVDPRSLEVPAAQAWIATLMNMANESAADTRYALDKVEKEQDLSTKFGG